MHNRVGNRLIKAMLKHSGCKSGGTGAVALLRPKSSIRYARVARKAGQVQTLKGHPRTNSAIFCLIGRKRTLKRVSV